MSFLLYFKQLQNYFHFLIMIFSIENVIAKEDFSLKIVDGHSLDKVYTKVLKEK